MNFDRDKGYRPEIRISGSDSLEKAGKQAAADQRVEAAIDTRDGERREEIYRTAQKFVDATESFGIKKRRTPEERALDLDRVATGIAFGINSADERARIVGVNNVLGILRPRATNGTRKKIFEDVAKALHEIHGLPYPPKQ